MCGDKKSTQTNAWQERDRKRVKTILQPLTVCIKKEEEAFTDKHNAYLILLASLVSIFIWHCLQVLHYDPHTFDSKYNIYIFLFFLCVHSFALTRLFSLIWFISRVPMLITFAVAKENTDIERTRLQSIENEQSKLRHYDKRSRNSSHTHTHTHFGVRAFPSHQS